MQKFRILKTLTSLLFFYVAVSLSNVCVTAQELEQIKNPVFHEGFKDVSGTDRTDWSFIYFGSYPQTEITDEHLKEQIDDVLRAGEVGDVIIDGVKYRKIFHDDTNEYQRWPGVPAGESRYFRWEPIKWRVLDIDEENGKVFVCANNVIDYQEYNEEYVPVTWETSTMRLWLNGSSQSSEPYKDPDRDSFTANAFYDTAFMTVEKEAILQTNIVTADNPEYKTDGGNNTIDKVFLLSYSEVTNLDFGFASYYDEQTNSRGLEATAYAKAIGGYEVEGDEWYIKNGDWKLRSPGQIDTFAMNCEKDGTISKGGRGNEHMPGGVVPALFIDISSDAWSIADGKDKIIKPVYHNGEASETRIGSKDTTDWSYIEFGQYPQSEVTDSNLKAKIDNNIALSNSDTGDVVVDGVKYRKISSSDAKSKRNWNDEDKYRYFKWEPIKWKVLNISESDNLLLFADIAVDCQMYSEGWPTYDGTWETSTMRLWLNGSSQSSEPYNDSDRDSFTESSFYDTAFSTVEKAKILKTTITNEDNIEYGTDGGIDTKDKVFLLSYNEATNRDYGFASSFYEESTTRGIKASAYAVAMGAGIDGSGEWYGGNTRWLLRSPGDSSSQVLMCGPDGWEFGDGRSCQEIGGVVPVIFFNDKNTSKTDEDPDESSKPESENQSSTIKPTNPTKHTDEQQNSDTTSTPKPTAGQQVDSKPVSPTATNKDITKSTVKILSTAQNSKKRVIIVKWTTDGDVNGYEIQYALDKKFKKSAKTKTVKSAMKKSQIIKNVKKGKTYYVRVRAYALEGSNKVYSSWSSKKKIKIKK